MKNLIKKLILSLTAFALILSPSLLSAAPGDIVDTAVNTPQLSTLVSLVDSAGLVEALQEPNGPYTVFAPTNEAFDKLPAIVNKALELDPELLSKILLYHVVSGDIKSMDVPHAARVTTLAGKDIFTRNKNGKVKINASKVIIPDVMTTNGTVHVVDRVIIPWRDVFMSLIENKHKMNN